MTGEVLAPDDSSTGLRLRDKFRGVVGFAMSVLLVYGLPLLWLVNIMQCLRRIARPAHAHEVARLVQAVRWAARVHPGRAACTEVSLAVCMASLFTLRLPTWCVGTRFRPVKQHAWVEVDGLPVSEPEVANWPYKPIVKI